MSGPIQQSNFIIEVALVFETAYHFVIQITKHDKVWGVSMHIILLQAAVKKLHITTSTVNILFMLDSKLKD